MRCLIRRALAAAILVAAGIDGSRAQSYYGPTIGSLDPSSVTAGSPTFTLVVGGGGFLKNAQVIWRSGGLGATTLPTTYRNSETLEATVDQGFLTSAGSLSVRVHQSIITDGGSFDQDSNAVTFTINPGLAIVTGCPLSNGVLGQPYNTTLQAAGGAPPYQFSLAQGALPGGLTLATNGRITGTPTANGTATFTLRVSDSQERTSTKGCSLTIGSPLPNFSIYTIEPNSVLAGSPNLTIAISGSAFRSQAVVLWNFGAGVNERPLDTTVINAAYVTAIIPANLLTNQTETPVPIAVRQPTGSLAGGFDTSNALPFTVVDQVIISTPCPLRDLSQAVAYSERLIVAGGYPGYVWTVDAGELPTGLELSGNGTLSGTPVRPGLFRFTLGAQDTRGNRATKACSQTVLGPLSAFPSTLTFNADSGGAIPPSQEISVTSAGGNVPFTAAMSQASWLRITSLGQTTPAIVRVEVVPNTVVAGTTQRAQIVFTSDRASNRTASVEVVLNVRAAQPPKLSAAPSILRFTAPRGGGRQEPKILRVLNLGGGTLNFTAEITPISGGNWFTLSALTGNTSAASPALLRAFANASNLGAGVYRSRVTFRSTGQDPVVVLATLTVSTSPESMSLSQSGLLFQAMAGGPIPPPQRFGVIASGQNGFFWEAIPSTVTGTPWLRVNPPSNTSRPGTSQIVDVQVEPGTLGPDYYFGEVQVKSAGVDNSPRLLSVVFQVIPPSPFMAPLIEPTGLVFTTPPGGGFPPAKTIRVYNLSLVPVAVAYQISGSTAFTSSGGEPVTVQPGGFRDIVVTANAAGLVAGTYRGQVVIHSTGDSKARVAELLLVVATGIGSAAVPDSARREAAGCTPTRLLPVSTLLTSGFVAQTGVPLPMEVRVVDDCGEAMTTGSVTASFSQSVQSPVALTYLTDSRWSGTLQVQPGTAGPLSTTITAIDSTGALQGSVTVSGDLQATTGIPTISDGGVVSSASFAAEAPLTPGGIMAAFGVGLADASASAGSLPLPTQLGTTRMSIAGRDVPIFFASSGQVNGVLPYDLVPNASFQLSIRRGTRRSNFAEVAVAGTQPAVFTLQSAGVQGIVVDGANQTVLVDASNPATRGGVVVIYLEGLGAVTPAVTAGSASPGGPLATVIAPVSVTIGGQPATVQFSGLTPFFTGLYQINAVVPQGVTPGSSVPVVVTAGGQVSPAVMIAVR